MGRIISDRSAEKDIKILNEGRAREIVAKILSLKLKVFLQHYFPSKGAAAAQMQQLPPAQLHLIAFR